MIYHQWIKRDLSFNTYLMQMLNVPIYKARQILSQAKLDDKSKAEVWETYRNKRYLDKYAKRNPINTKIPTIIQGKESNMKDGIKKHIERKQKKEYLIEEIKFTLGLFFTVGGGITAMILHWIQFGY